MDPPAAPTEDDMVGAVNKKEEEELPYPLPPTPREGDKGATLEGNILLLLVTLLLLQLLGLEPVSDRTNVMGGSDDNEVDEKVDDRVLVGVLNV